MPTFKRPKPKAIVFDVTGVIAKKAFMSNSEESKNFIRNNIKDYVRECFMQKEFRLSITYLKNPSMLNKGQATPGSPAPPIADINASFEEQMESVIANVLWRCDFDVPSLAYFHLNMSIWGYNKGVLKTPVYEEVPTVLKKWKEVDKIKLYVTLGSASFLKKVFTQTTAGDLIGNVEGHMNLMVGGGNSKDFRILAPLLKEQASNILVITRLPQDARRANLAKIPAVLVLRSDYEPKAAELLKNLDKSKLNQTQNKTRSAMNTQVLDREAASNLETISGAEDDSLAGPTSKITEKDLRDFPVIQRLDELVWT